MIVIGLGIASLLTRYILFEVFLAKPLADMNKHIVKQLEVAANNIDTQTYYGPERENFKTDAEWEKEAFSNRMYAPPQAIRPDDSDAEETKTQIPVPPSSSWILFSSIDAGGKRIMHARLPLEGPDGVPFLAIELSEPQHAIADAGGAAQISVASVKPQMCGTTDALVLRFDHAAPMRYATRGVWSEAGCGFAVPDFPQFRDAVINATMLYVRLAKGKALTQELPAPVGGLSWNP
jgi:hypothetical protein